MVRVVDGDTVDVDLNGKTERLRLIGIDTPEIVDPLEPVQCYGREASAKAKELLPEGAAVRIDGDPTQDTRNQYGRLLVYLWLPDGRIFNQVMVVDGYAFEYTYRVPYHRQAEFTAAERGARESGRGLWASSACNGQRKPASETGSVPSPVISPVVSPPVASDCAPEYPGVCIPPYPPDLDCGQIPFKRFRVLQPDPHRFDGNRDGIGCE